MKRALFILLLSAACLLADASGKWSGMADSGTPGGESHTLFLILNVQGKTLTGSGGPNEETQHPMQNGTVEGDKLKFQVPGGKGVLHFDLKAAGDQITGEVRMKTNDGEDAPLKVSLKRVK
ncbi:MAG TPA: hypothetical protein VGF59_12335 [Bryobacteraceae bacterium]|jgi:hypothetical protein